MESDMTDLEKFLRENFKPPPPPPVERSYTGTWYRDGDIPH
jgi:hypothetical protein